MISLSRLSLRLGRESLTSIAMRSGSVSATRIPAKAAGRVDALCWGHLTNTRSRAALARLPDALELPAEVVAQAVTETEQVLAEHERHAEEERRRAREKEEAEFRAAFRPHAVRPTD